MTDRPRAGYASVRVLDAAVDAAAAADRFGPVRLRQLRMTVRQVERALAVDGVLSGRARRDVKSLLNPRNVRAFLTLAATGALRDDAAKRDRELSVASVRILRDCLGILGEETGHAVALPSVSQPAARPLVPPAQQATLYRRLADMAEVATPSDWGAMPLRRRVQAMGRVRALALVGVVLDSGARAGELCAQRLVDLGEGLGTVRLVRRPQNGSDLPASVVAARAGVSRSTVSRVLSDDPRASDAATDAVLAAVEQLGAGGPVVERHELREGTQVALARWLDARQHLVENLDGRRRALWVSLTPQGAAPPGAALQPRGLERAFARDISALNAELAGQWDVAEQGPWVPLPTRLEQLRRSVASVESIQGERSVQ